jgi:hypothetical protein
MQRPKILKKQLFMPAKLFTDVQNAQASNPYGLIIAGMRSGE